MTNKEQEPIKAIWIKRADTPRGCGEYLCSNCMDDDGVDLLYDYCPNCGIYHGRNKETVDEEDLKNCTYRNERGLPVTKGQIIQRDFPDEFLSLIPLFSRDWWNSEYKEPKTGHWKLVQRGKLIDVCCSNCGAVRIKGYAYNYTINELNKEDINECFRSAEMSFCPNCGSDNREVEE